MPSFFVPARSSRHRRACFALYKSLIRQGLRVPLPDDLTTASPLGLENPIKTLIRNGFRRNKRDTSPRLVVSALKNGYRYLTLLSRAADPSAPEHASVLAFLRENQARVLALREKAAAEAAKRVSTAPIEGRLPLIRKVSAEGEPPVYEPTGPPRPLESFRSGVRKPPTLSATGGVPFLRLKKPQPRFLERVLRQKSRNRAGRVAKMLEMLSDGMEDAVVEDEWESLVGKMLAAEEGEEREMGKKKRAGPRKTPVVEKEAEVEESYAKSLRCAVLFTSDAINKEREDLVARGKAMWQIVLAEQEMALKEEKERLMREGRGGEEPQLRVRDQPVWTRRKRRPGSADGKQQRRQPKPSEATKAPEQQT